MFGVNDQQTTNKRLFHSMDMLRGIAAIAVVAFHQDHLNSVLPSGYLAVDLFFVLSGFVIAHAYEGRFRCGLSFAGFMKIRLVRLYPMYMIGTVAGLLTFLLVTELNARAIIWPKVIASFALAAVFLPTTPQISANGFHLFPFNFPAWSLLWELAINATFALIALRLSNRMLLIIIGLGAAALVLTAYSQGSLAGGSNFSNFLSGPGRVTYSFFMGVWLCRQRLPSWKVPLPITVAVLLAMFVIRPSPASWLYDVGEVLFIIPVIVVLAVAEPNPRYRGLCTLMGIVSYPVYALHASGLDLERTVASAAERHLGITPLLCELLYVLAVVAAAIPLERYLDRPLRAKLARSAFAT